MYQSLDVCVVIPAYNEARLIGKTLASIPRWVDHVVVVDDRSEDETASLARRAGASNVTVVQRRFNGGVGAAILTGYDEAFAMGAHVAVVMAGDGQMDGEEIPLLLEPIARGEADYTKGTRLGHPELLQRMPLSRVVGNVALTIMSRPVTGQWGLLDSQCGYTALRTTFIPYLDKGSIYHRYGFPNDLLAHLDEIGARIVDVPVTPIYGDETSGITIPTALMTMPAILAKAWARRLYRKHVASY